MPSKGGGEARRWKTGKLKKKQRQLTKKTQLSHRDSMNESIQKGRVQGAVFLHETAQQTVVSPLRDQNEKSGQRKFANHRIARGRKQEAETLAENNVEGD